MSAFHPFCEPRRPEFNLDPGLEGLMHSHYNLTNQRAKDSALVLAQPILHGTRIQHREISISKDFPTVCDVGVPLLWNFERIIVTLNRRHQFDLVGLSIAKLGILVEHVIS